MSDELELQNSAESSSSKAETTTKVTKSKKIIVPDELKDDDIKTTKVTTLKKTIDDTLLALKDLATLELFMPSSARMRERLKSIKENSSARHIKIKGHWKTTNPIMHITKLRGIKINNDESEISFSVFEMDKEGNKVCHEQKTQITKENGDTFSRVTSAEYRIAYEVTEKIKTGKPITREIMKIEGLN